MTLHYSDDTVALHHGDALQVLRTLSDNSVDSVCTDPPYGLAELPTSTVTAALTAWLTGDREHVPDGRGFMGNDWDRFVPPPALWDECYRVLKPGGHLLAFCAPRTVDLLTMSIRLADFEIRDGIDWMFATGFPKSLDVAKAIDRIRDDRDDVLAVTSWLAERAERAGVTRARIDEHMGTSDMGGWWLSRLRHRCSLPTNAQWDRLRDLIGFGPEMDAEVYRLNVRKGEPGEAWMDAKVLRTEERTHAPSGLVDAGQQLLRNTRATRQIKAPNTDAARQWAGWGTALKPAREPIVVARKPLAGTVATNLLQHGTGALNIAACRTAAGQDYRDKCASVVGLASNRNGDAYGEWAGVRADSAHDAGRWPTNVVLSHSEWCEVCDCGSRGPHAAAPHCYAFNVDCVPGCPVSELGNNARFFPTFRYEAKAPASERPRVDGEAHATVKPLSLMRWLVQLVTPPGGTVLEPFAGSGTTIEACLIEGFRCIAVEREKKHLPLIMSRISKPIAPTLFSEMLGGAA